MPRLLAGWPLATALLLPLLTAPALAGSVTADSVWDRNDARQRALQQVPKGATVSRTSCEVISVGMGNDRYRCTVWYEKESAPSAPPQAGPQVPGTSP
jgi:predicted exporter